MKIPWSIPPSRFFPIEDGMSTIWDKKGTAEECQSGARSPPNNFGVVKMNVGNVRHIPNLEYEGPNNGNMDAIHKPTAKHIGHAIVIGFPMHAEDVQEIQIKLSRISQWVIVPESLNWLPIQ